MYLFLGIYTLFLVVIWGFFIITKIHAYKFKNLGSSIELVTKILLIILIILSIAGYGIIIYISSSSDSLNLQFNREDFYFNEVNY